jgi:hypothetical protein
MALYCESGELDFQELQHSKMLPSDVDFADTVFDLIESVLKDDDQGAESTNSGNEMRSSSRAPSENTSDVPSPQESWPVWGIDNSDDLLYDVEGSTSSYGGEARFGGTSFLRSDAPPFRPGAPSFFTNPDDSTLDADSQMVPIPFRLLHASTPVTGMQQAPSPPPGLSGVTRSEKRRGHLAQRAHEAEAQVVTAQEKAGLMAAVAQRKQWLQMNGGQQQLPTFGAPISMSEAKAQFELASPSLNAMPKHSKSTKGYPAQKQIPRHQAAVSQEEQAQFAVAVSLQQNALQATKSRGRQRNIAAPADTKLKYCHHCGSSVQPSFQFCSSCGKSIQQY